MDSSGIKEQAASGMRGLSVVSATGGAVLFHRQQALGKLVCVQVCKVLDGSSHLKGSDPLTTFCPRDGGLSAASGKGDASTDSVQNAGRVSREQGAGD